jgi:alpha-glucosidase
MHVYNGSVPNKFVYYEDDGKTYNYEKNEFYKRTIEFDPTKLTISLDEVSGSFTSKFHYVKLLLHGFNQLKNVKAGTTALRVLDKAYTMVPTMQNSTITEAGSVRVYELTLNNSREKQIISYD